MRRLASLWCLAAGASAACDTRSPAVARSDSPTAVQSDTPAVARIDSTPPAQVASPSAANPLTLGADGWGPLRIGMTLAQVVAASGADANPQAVGGPDPATCDEFRPTRAPASLLVMIQRGRLTRISLGAGSTTRTDQGFRVGDLGSAIRASYGAKAVTTPHEYQAPPAEYITVWTVAPPGDTARGIRYEIASDGRVARIHAGGPSIQNVEGCL